MSRRQSQMFHRPHKRSSRSPGGGIGVVGFILAVMFLVFILGSLVQFLQSPGFSFVAFLALIVVGVFIWRKRKQKNQWQEWQMLQQHEAWRQHQQQEAVRQQLARQQWEQQEKERQEQERITLMRSLGDILVLTPREFEWLIKRILEQNGALNVLHIGRSGDLGVDLSGFDLNGNQIIVQCKRYAPGRTVGSPDIQKFIGMMNVHHKAQKGVFVTTTIFTQPAINLAAQHNILLIDGDRLVKLLQGIEKISI